MILIIACAGTGAQAQHSATKSCKSCECQFSNVELLSSLIEAKVAVALNNSLEVFIDRMSLPSDIEALIDRKINSSLINNPGEMLIKM